MKGAVTPYRFTVDEYYRMAQAGIFHEDDHVELIEGEILKMAPIGSRHAGCVDSLNRKLSRALGDRAQIRVQNPVRLSARNEPEPDIAVLRPRDDEYRSGHPGPEDVLLIIEVADTSLDYDRDVKPALYAAAGIPEVWIADLHGEQISAHREPVNGSYQRVTVYRRGDALTAELLPALTLSVDEILG